MEGGIGWIVVLATFVINAIVQGIIASSGILLNVLLDQFKHEGKAKIGWIPSLLGGLLLAVGPLSSYLTEKYSCRTVTVVGALIAVFGCIISYFARSVTNLIFSYGIITGFGFGLLYVPQTIIVAEWFRDKRSTATGVGLSGSGFGAFIIPPLSQYILREYGWHSYFLAAALAVSLCVLFGLLLIPNPEWQVEKRRLASSGRHQLVAWDCLKDPAFVMFCISTGLFSATYRVPFSFLPDYAVRQLHTSKPAAAYFLSYLGLASFLGRLLGGLVGDSLRNRRFLVFLVFIVLSGLSVVGMGLADNYTQLGLCSFMFGAASGGRVALNSIILADLFGLSALSQTFGLVCLVQGVSIFFGIPVAGWLADVFADYRTSFILFGTAMMACASVLSFIPLSRRLAISAYSERRVSWTLRILPFLILPFLLSGTLKHASAIEVPTASPSKPNIIFIMADDLGWNDVSFHGYNEIPTPNIDALAKNGIILNSYYAQYMCSPSRSALMTGKYPIRTGMQHYVLKLGEPRGLNVKEKILPQYLRENGYINHMIGKWHLGYYRRSMIPTNRGFDTFFGYYSGSSDYYNYTNTAGVPADYIGFELWDNLRPAREYVGQYATEVFTQKAVDRIHQHNFDQPLFLYLSHFAPHWANEDDPVQAPEKYVKRFPNIKHEGRRKYAATVSALDDSVGAVVQALKAKYVLDNTVIVFSSDNGGAGAEQEVLLGKPVTFASNWPLRGAKTSQWEGGVRVSCVLSSPLLKKTAYVSNELYHITDWLPTFLGLAGGTVEASQLDGLDIWKSLSKGLPSPRKEVLIQADPVWHEYAIRSNQFKLVLGSLQRNGSRIDQWYEPEGGLDVSLIIDTPGALICDQTAALGEKQTRPCNAFVAPCLFDVVKDPCEFKNLAEERPDIVGVLYEKIKEYNRTALPSDNLPLDPRAKAALNDFLIQPYLD